MIVAVMDQNGMVQGHFGKGESVHLYLIENNEIVMERIHALVGSGYSAMNELLSLRVGVVIGYSITPACRLVLRDNDVKLFMGVSGTVENAVRSFLLGKLTADEEEGGCSGSCSSCATKCH